MWEEFHKKCQLQTRAQFEDIFEIFWNFRGDSAFIVGKKDLHLISMGLFMKHKQNNFYVNHTQNHSYVKVSVQWEHLREKGFINDLHRNSFRLCFMKKGLWSVRDTIEILNRFYFLYTSNPFHVFSFLIPLFLVSPCPCLLFFSGHIFPLVTLRCDNAASPSERQPVKERKRDIWKQ